MSTLVSSEDRAGSESRIPTQADVDAWLVKTYQEFFGDEPIDASSDFFELGGTSLTAIKLLSRVEAKFGAEVLSPETLFDDGRLSNLAAAIKTALEQRRGRA